MIYSFKHLFENKFIEFLLCAQCKFSRTCLPREKNDLIIWSYALNIGSNWSNLEQSMHENNYSKELEIIGGKKEFISPYQWW